MLTMQFVLALFQQQPEISLPLGYQIIVGVATIAGAFGASRAGTAAAIKAHDLRIKKLEDDSEKNTDRLASHGERLARVEGKIFSNGAALRP